MRSSRSRSGSRPATTATALIASLALHGTLLAALARLPCGVTRDAEPIPFASDAPFAWVARSDPAPDLPTPPEPHLVDDTPPPPMPPLPPPSLKDDSPCPTEYVPPPDPSITELPPPEVAPPAAPATERSDPRLASGRLPPLRGPAKRASAPSGATADAPRTNAPLDRSAPPPPTNAGEASKGAVVGAAVAADGNAAPDYPRAARRLGLEGVVVLSIEIGADGSCTGVKVAESSGHDILDDAAVAAVRKWKFHPALKDGVAVASQLLLPVRFVLKTSASNGSPRRTVAVAQNVATSPTRTPKGSAGWKCLSAVLLPGASFASRDS